MSGKVDTVMTVEDLKAELKSLSLSTQGKKEILYNRLLAAPGVSIADIEKKYKDKKLKDQSQRKSHTLFSRSADKWIKVDLPMSEVIEQEQGFANCVGDFEKENAEFMKRLSKELDPFKIRYPTVDDRVILYCYFMAGVVDLIVDCSKELDRQDVILAFAAAMVLNCMTVSNELGWKLAMNSFEYKMEKLLSIISKIHISKVGDSTAENDSWIPKAELDQLYRKASETLNKRLDMLHRNVVTIDDDIHNTLSSQLKDGEAFQACIVRKDGWCVVWDVLCSLVDGLPSHVHLRESGGDSTMKFLRQQSFRGGEMVYYDRGYTSAEATEYLHSKNVGSIGPLKVHMTKDHCYDLETLPTWESECATPDPPQRSGSGYIKMTSFPGVGPTIQVAKNSRTNTLVVGTIVRTSETSDGFCKFMGSDPHTASNALHIQNMVNFVRVHQSMPHHEKRTNLALLAASGNLDARAFVNLLEINGCSIVTVTQRDAAWGNSRHLRLTGSQAGSAIRRVLKLEPSKFKNLRAALWQEGGTDDDDVPHSDEAEPPITTTSWTCAGIGCDVNTPKEAGDNELVVDEDESPGEELEERLAQFCCDEGSDESEDDVEKVEEVAQTQSSVAPSISSGSTSTPPVVNSSSSSSAPQPLPDALAEARRKNLTGVANSMRLHKSTKAMKIGTKTEPEILKFASHLPVLKNNQIFNIGLIASTSVPYLAFSPDGLAYLTETNEPVIIECKTKVLLSKHLHLARNVKPVDAGTPEFYQLVPSEYRTQLLHMASTSKIRNVLVCISGVDGPYRTILIRYNTGMMDEYVEAAQHETIKSCFSWFFDHALDDSVSNEALISSIPSESPAHVKRLIASHVRVLRAIYRYWIKNQRAPIQPTKCFRFGIINSYDIGKAGVDNFCKDIAQAMKASTFCLKWRQLAAMRYMYMATIASIKTHTLYSYLKSRGSSSDSVVKFRSNVRKHGGRMTDAVVELALLILENPDQVSEVMESCSEEVSTSKKRRSNSARTSSAMSIPPRTPSARSKITVRDIVALCPEIMYTAALENAKAHNRDIVSTDIYHGVVVAHSILSSTSPDVMVTEKYVKRIEGIALSILRLIQEKFVEKRSMTRIEFWDSIEGIRLRQSSDIVQHSIRKYPAARRTCVYCGSTTTFALQCGVCAEILCEDCNYAHHMGETIASRTERKEGEGIFTTTDWCTPSVLRNKRTSTGKGSDNDKKNKEDADPDVTIDATPSSSSSVPSQPNFSNTSDSK
jgi:SAP domain